MIRHLISAALAGLALCGPAAAATSVQDLADATEVWLQDELGAPALHRPVTRASSADLSLCAAVIQARGSGATCAGIAWRDRIAVDRWTWEEVSGLTLLIDGSDGPWAVQPIGYQTLLHEILHRGTAFDLLEEGLVDSLAWDLMPAASRAVLGEVLPAQPVSYGPQVHLVRKASALACGCSWRSRGARGLRRAWWAADSPTRHQVVAAALASAGR